MRDQSPSADLKLFIKDVHDLHGRKRPLEVRPWACVKDVKDMLSRLLHVPPSSQSIYFGALLGTARELPNHRSLQDAGIYRNGETLLLEINGCHQEQRCLGDIRCSNSGGPSPPASVPIASLRNKSDICVSSSTLDLCPKPLQRTIQQSRRGMALGFKPVLAPDGSGGAYFLSDARGRRVGVFKPADEEPFAENNPRGYVPHSSVGNEESAGEDEGLRQGIRPGELCLREVAAYLLDHGGFSGVPMTTLAEARHPALHSAGQRWTLAEGGAGVGVHALNTSFSGTNLVSGMISSPSPVSAADLTKKVGSFQDFVRAECTMDDLSPSKVSVDEVHKIAILDMRLMNADRNVANVLCRRLPEDPDRFILVPIDHGYSLRSNCDVAWFDWCWLDWPQTKEPLSEASRSYVLNLDVEADAKLLEERLDMNDEVLDHFRSSCLVLKAGVRAGLTLYEIASEILCRNDPCGDVPSKLETLTTMATEIAMSAVHNGRFHHSTASLALVEQLSSRDLFASQRAPSIRFSIPNKVHGFSRSTSSSNFPRPRVPSLGGISAFTDELFGAGSSFSTEMLESRHSTHANESPDIVQTSQSDNSDDLVSLESEAEDFVVAGEWAAALVAVADQSMDMDQHAIRQRNDSVSSSTTMDSDLGFWHVRPGASSLDDMSSEDDRSVSWTPSVQSSNRPSLIEEGNLPVPPHIFSASNLAQLMSKTKLEEVRTDVSNEDDELAPLSTPTCVTGPATSLLSSTILSQPKKTIARSMSYTAFSSFTPPNSGTAHSGNDLLAQSTTIRSGRASARADGLFRAYYLKFVDLLAVREVERIARGKAVAEDGDEAAS